MNCKEAPFIEIDAKNFILHQFDCKPIEGYIKPINKETGAELPFCCSYHERIFNQIVTWLENFPNCCEKHKNEYKNWQLNKSNYKDLPMKIVSQLSYTEYHIIKKIDADNWYKDITDYIEYNVYSFGQPSIGLEFYLDNLKIYLKYYLDMSKENKDEREYQFSQLLEFIDYYYKLPEKEQTSLNLLYDTYRKWLAIFPFEVSYFATIKEKYQNTLPVLKETFISNPYLNIYKAKLHTKSSLIEVLINLTNQLLTEINGVILYEKKLIDDVDKTRLELLCESRKLKLKRGYTNSSPNEEEMYIRILEEWFKDEKQFFEDLSKILNESKTHTIIQQNANKIYNVNRIDNANFS